MDETIAAIATAAGVGGVGIIRVSGARAIEVVAACLGLRAAELDRTVRLGVVRDVDGQRVDQVLAFAMRAPASFTGEDVAELHGHGGRLNLSRLLATVVARGARIAAPGEFTRRAFAHGKLDLVRAEALVQVIEAGSDRAWRLAQSLLAGELGRHVAALEARALAVLAEVEGAIDFPDEDLDVQGGRWVAAELGAVAAACAALAGSFVRGRAVTEGISVALVGPVNVGKSSLLNALIGRERALVAEAPGTTRDYLEIQDTWSGVPVTLIDTAGVRPTEDPVEARGIALGARRIDAADVVVVVNDGVAPWDDGARFGRRAVVVRSKADLVDGAAVDGAALSTSATRGAGLGELRVAVLACAGLADEDGGEDLVLTTARQHALAREAAAAFSDGLAGLASGRPIETVALELRQGASALARLRGVEVGERVLDEVFARFCIGK
jgi:tRNA modification GTPase